LDPLTENRIDIPRSPVHRLRTVAPKPLRTMPPPPTEQTRWFADEVHPHGSSLKMYLRRSFPAVRDIDDVVQESYARIWRVRATQPILSAKAFLFKVARHIALDFLRRNTTSPVDPLGDLAALRVLDDKPNAAEVLSGQEKLDLLADAVMALPACCREVVILRKIQGVPQKEVAARLGLSERTVENHCRLGVKRCEHYLRARGIKNLYGDES
jgi:RNA polymerase sigma factor (sigma-70 family)